MLLIPFAPFFLLPSYFQFRFGNQRLTRCNTFRNPIRKFAAKSAPRRTPRRDALRGKTRRHKSRSATIRKRAPRREERGSRRCTSDYARTGKAPESRAGEADRTAQAFRVLQMQT